MMRVVYLPALDRAVTVGALVKAIKRVKAAPPDAVFPQGLTTWWPTTGAEIMRQFRQGMNERINEGIPYAERGVQR